MQKALESFLGPAAGLVGLFIFILIWTPKFVVKWRGSRARKAEQAKMKLVHDASRSLVLEPQGVDDIEDHIMHGRAIRSFKTAKSRAIIICLALCLPLALIYFLVPVGYMSMRVYLLIAGTFFAFLGLMTLRHLGDSATFYKTGAVWRTNGKRYDIDYNTIVDVTTRSALIPGAAGLSVVHFVDGSLAVLDGFYMHNGRALNDVFEHLTERRIRSAADENRRLMS